MLLIILDVHFEGDFPDSRCLNRDCKKCGSQNIHDYYAELLANEQVASSEVTYQMTLPGKNGSTKRCISCVQKQSTFKQFLSDFESDLATLASHLFRASWQLKSNYESSNGSVSTWGRRWGRTEVTNAIKMQYDLLRLINIKWAYLLKNEGKSGEIKACKYLLKLVKMEWSEKVTKLARSTLTQRQFTKGKEIPSPEDIRQISEYVINDLKKTKFEENAECFKSIVNLVQARLLMYNKRRSGEIDGIRYYISCFYNFSSGGSCVML